MPKPDRMFWIVSALLLVWNLMGLAAYYMQANMDLAVLARTDPYQARLFAEMPQWAWWAYGIAVGAGLLGALGLLLRRRWAALAFIVSLAGVVAQFGYSFLGTDLLAVRGVSAAVVPLFIAALAVVEIWFARREAAKEVLR